MFFISAGMLIGTGILFVLFSDSTEQPWNTFKDEDNGDKELNIQYSKVPLEEEVRSNEKYKERS